MLLKNIGSKIISVGTEILMPDDEKAFTAQALDTPAIKALIAHGFLSIREEEPVKAEAPKAEEPKVEEPAEAVETTDAEAAEDKKPKRTRVTKAKE